MSSDIVAFTNPSAPTDTIEDEKISNKKLTNDDFRSILMTPRAGADDIKTPHANMQPPKKVDHDKKKVRRHIKPQRKPDASVDRSAAKSTSTPYRDRAKERREGKVEETSVETPVETAAVAGQYNAMSGRPSDNIAQAESRRQLIKESKYLGGDIQHTHLVKGLDYVLLGKARRDIETKQKEIRSDIDKNRLDLRKDINDSSKSNSANVYATNMCKKIVQTLFEKKPIKRNLNFQPGRMAYRIDLDDDYAEFDVPTTIHRSIMECGKSEEYTGVMSTNQRVISNLTNILSYLRVERKQAKKAKLKERVEDREIKDPVGKDFNMFGDLPESQDKKHRDRKSHGDRHSNNYTNLDKKHSDKKSNKYFDKPVEELIPQNPLDKMKMHVKNLEKRSGIDEKTHDDQMLKYLKKKASTTGYDECYPELLESFDAMGDSDDEADYTKMDMGNKKGPVGRWDFENQEDYSKYMSNKEALPKAAFQYGVKMADGRKTRRINGQVAGGKDNKAHLDKEWKQIKDVLANKRTVANNDGPASKKHKM